MSLPAFVSIPRPVKGMYKKAKKQCGDVRWVDWQLRVYLGGSVEKELVQRAAKLCGCTVSEYLRQCALNTTYALGVLNVPGPDQRSLQTSSEDSQ